MKFTVGLIGLLCISASYAKDSKAEEPKDKREAPLGYPSSGHATQTLQIQPSHGHQDLNAISIGAGYSVGGAKGALGYGGHGPAVQYESVPSNGGHAALQLPPITLQPGHGNLFSGDISQLMSQLSHGLSTGAIQLQPVSGYHSEAASQAHEQVQPQFSYGSPKLQQYSVSEQQFVVPTYAVGTKGLGSYGSGSTGPVLFNPSESHNVQAAPAYTVASQEHAFGEAPFSLNNGGHHFGGASFKSLGGGYGGAQKVNFKPSAFLGSSVQGDGAHGISALSTHAIPSFGQSFAGAHGPISSGGQPTYELSSGSFGGSPSKYSAQSYTPTKGGFASAAEISAAFSGNSHISSPPSTTYGIPSSAYSFPASSAHVASSSPQHYFTSSKQGAQSSFGEGSHVYKAPHSSHSSLSSLSSSPKYSFGGHASFPKFSSSKDSNGAYSEPVYNTIKYSEELKPRVH